MNIKGSLPLLILHNLAGGPSHGYQISKSIKQQSDGVLNFKEGTLYPTLHSLEKQGMIEGFREKENGRVRRYYRLTDQGASLLEAQKQEWAQFSQAVNTILSNNNLQSAQGIRRSSS